MAKGFNACAKISLASGGTSGTYYGFSGVIAQTLNASLKDVLNIKVESTGASKANVQLVDAGESQIAILQNDVMTYAYQATDMFAGSKPVTSFSAVASCYPETIQIVASKKINSIEELIKYVSRYCSRPVIAESRILNYDGKFVTWFYYDHTNEQYHEIKDSALSFINRPCWLPPR